jgi:shikimate kinase/3-dehydroquinate synthase
MKSANLFLYGPPGSGKSTVAKALANNLELPFIDLDAQIEKETGMTIPEIFAQAGENKFRQLEAQYLSAAISGAHPAVISLGGGALLAPECRYMAESAGEIICLQAPDKILLQRSMAAPGTRPLLIGNQADRLKDLLTERRAHYESFPIQIPTGSRSVEAILSDIRIRVGRFHLQGMSNPYDIRIQAGSTRSINDFLPPSLAGKKVVVVTDEHVGTYYEARLVSQLSLKDQSVDVLTIPAGESSKSIESLMKIWDGLLKAGADRKSVLLAMGGGMIGDLAGFAAATFLRGIPWINLPSTLLAQVDAGIGGKTGINLPQGKNLAGAFYPPALVLIDPELLLTLPQAEQYNGMAEVIKHGVIADPILFERCSAGKSYLESSPTELVSRAAAVKIHVVQIDPFESSHREALNFGHTVGHAVEKAYNFELRHGEAVAIGMVAEAFIAEQLGIALQGLYLEIAAVLQKFELPTHLPEDLTDETIEKTARYDKKRQHARHRLALPSGIGQVQVGVEIEDLTPLLAEFRRSYSP